jgi:hypothetical protein
MKNESPHIYNKIPEIIKEIYKIDIEVDPYKPSGWYSPRYGCFRSNNTKLNDFLYLYNNIKKYHPSSFLAVTNDISYKNLDVDINCDAYSNKYDIELKNVDRKNLHIVIWNSDIDYMSEMTGIKCDKKS